MDVFNYYETEKISVNEAELALINYAKTNDQEYSLYQGLLSHPEIQPGFIDYMD